MKVWIICFIYPPAKFFLYLITLSCVFKPGKSSLSQSFTYALVIIHSSFFHLMTLNSLIFLTPLVIFRQLKPCNQKWFKFDNISTESVLTDWVDKDNTESQNFKQNLVGLQAVIRAFIIILNKTFHYVHVLVKSKLF